MKERRTTERHNLIMYLRVHDRTTDDLVGHVVDVSTGGMMLVADNPFQPKETRQLRMVLPSIEEPDRTVDIDVECRWCGPDVNDTYFDAGFRFLNESAELREIIRGVVDDVGFAA